MQSNRQNTNIKSTATEAHIIDQGLRSYMLKVYNYMASGVFLTGIVSLVLFRLSGGYDIQVTCQWYHRFDWNWPSSLCVTTDVGSDAGTIRVLFFI